MPDVTYHDFILAQAKALRAQDAAPANRGEWQRRRTALRSALLAAMGPTPEKPCELEPKSLGVLKRSGYSIEKLVIQTRPDVWATCNVYVPGAKGKHPAVLVVHGHWAGARRDPVVQARCIGLVKLGFVVLAIDAFGAGERFTTPARGTYHGALYGSTLWPVGHSLLGMQVYDNRRAVDYLTTRPDVDGTRLGITGASGGGNQSMYAGALDERFQAVVPVCSVGSYQAYLKAACCVCELLPGALRFTEEGDVLGLVAPRALLVISASRDAYQFNPAQAEVSIDRAQTIFALNAVGNRLKHQVFESGHDYSKPMREAMYGWMLRWLKNEGQGFSFDEPSITLETPEDLACYPSVDDRPARFLFPPVFAERAGRELVERADKLTPKHAEEWESTTTQKRSDLKRILGGLPKLPRVQAKPGRPTVDSEGLETSSVRLNGEADLAIPLSTYVKSGPVARQPSCILLHLDGKAAAMAHPAAKALARKGWLVVAPDLRACGDNKPAGDGVRTAPDHNSAEHALWIGRPLLGQWVTDILTVLDWLALQPGRDPQRVAVVGLGQAGLLALTAGALAPDRITTVATVNGLTTLLTPKPYADGTRMGLLAPGLLTVGDVPHLAAMCAPRKLLLADGERPDGERLDEKVLRKAFAFTGTVYRAHGASTSLIIRTETRADDLARLL